MSLNEVKFSPSALSQVVLKHYGYKLKGHSGLIYSLIIIQLTSALLSMGLRSGMSSSSEDINIAINTYSGDFLFIFSCLWMIVITTLLSSQPYRSMEFSIVNNRVASHASNILLILTYAVFAGMTAILLTEIHRLMIAVNLKEGEFLIRGLGIAPQDLFLGIIAATFYLILLAAVTYFIQTLSSLHKGLGIILWIFLFVFGFGTIGILGFSLGNVLRFYTAEASLGLFILKVLSTVLLLFGTSVLITRGREVER